MFKNTKLKYYAFGAALTTGMIAGSSSDAFASNNFSTIARTITTSIQDLPGLLTGLAYMFGLLLAVLGIMKIKDHVENPSQTPLKDGAIRLLAGGALFALPMVLEAMTNTIGASSSGAAAAHMNAISFSVN